MKIHAFQIRQDGGRSLEALVEAIMLRPLENRVFNSGPPGMRLEAVNADPRAALLYLDFARPRNGHGPGRMNRRMPIQDIDIGDDSFGEDTAMVYEARTGFAAIQFNPTGPRQGAINQYLNAAEQELGPVFGPNNQMGFTFAPRYRPEAAARVRDFRFVRKINFTVSVSGLNRADFDAGRSVGAILRAPMPNGINEVTITMSAGRARGASLALDSAFAMLADLEQLGGDLTGGSVTGKTEWDGAPDTVDLVDERVAAVREIRAGRGQRYARPERWIACREALEEWRATGQLQ